MTLELQQQLDQFRQEAQLALQRMQATLVCDPALQDSDYLDLLQQTEAIQVAAAQMGLTDLAETTLIVCQIWRVLRADPLGLDTPLLTALQTGLESLTQILAGLPDALSPEGVAQLGIDFKHQLQRLTTQAIRDPNLVLTLPDVSTPDLFDRQEALVEVTTVTESPLPNLWDDMTDWIPGGDLAPPLSLSMEMLAEESDLEWDLEHLDLLGGDPAFPIQPETLVSDPNPEPRLAEGGGATSFASLDRLLDEPADSWTGLPAAAVFDALEQLIELPPTAVVEEPSAGSSTPDMAFPDPAISLANRAEPVLRVPVKQMDTLGNLVGEVVVNRNSLASSRERLQETLESLLQQVQSLSQLGEQMHDMYERSLLESALLGTQRQEGAIAPDMKSTSNVDQEFDRLEMDRFSNFHTVSQEMIELTVRMREAAADLAFIVNEPLDQVNRNFQQISGQLQEGVNRVRMAPFSELAGRLPRAVRQVAQRLGRSVRLEIEGEETLIDKGILQRLQDPMTHLINNALTHGIEAPEKRQQRGKPNQGTLRIHAYLQGNRTIISVADDGAGINLERVKQKAIQANLLTLDEAEYLDQRDIYDFLFHPGFSTRDKADDLSGRGVGMDVVRTVLKEIQGEIVTDSQPGKGTTFTIRLPQTLSIAKAIVCLSDRARIAIPMDSVLETLDLARHRLQPDAQGNFQLLRAGRVVPVRPMSSLLCYTQRQAGKGGYGGVSQSPEDLLSLVLLSSGGEQLALEVDQVEGEREIVIKPLEGPVPKPIGIAGVTIQADGRVMAIADVMQLFDLVQGRKRLQAAHWRLPETAEAGTVATVLIVDDSITVRELLSSTFKKAGYRVEQASNGQEVLEKLHSGLTCDLVFCDIEMPKMNGLELLERLQSSNELQHIPVAMLTSRGAERHRQVASRLGARAYFTKPYLEDTLLDAAKRLLKGEHLLRKI
jgi:chemotaxis protein histidine kinase CheA/ActR/RegA family two-component response regulator